MGDANTIRTLGYYSKPSHEGYKNTIELPVGNNVVPLRSDTIWLLQNGCSFHRLRSNDPNQHLKDFLKLVDSLNLDGENRERGSDYLFPCSILSTRKDYKTPQRYPDVLTTSRRMSLKSIEPFQGLTPKSPSSWHRSLAPKDLALYDNESWNDPRDFAKPVKTISLPQDVPSTSDLVPTTLSIAWKILNKPLLNMHPYVPKKRENFNNQSNLKGFVSNFMASQDARLSKFEADFKQQQSEMTNKIDIVLKAITDRMAGALPSDTVKNPKLHMSLVLSIRSYPTIDPQCLSHPSTSINAFKTCSKEAIHSHTSVNTIHLYDTRSG
ncbi:hypothetical protein Tco_0985725, partial [Tanacetum coccineum]